MPRPGATRGKDGKEERPPRHKSALRREVSKKDEPLSQRERLRRELRSKLDGHVDKFGNPFELSNKEIDSLLKYKSAGQLKELMKNPDGIDDIMNAVNGIRDEVMKHALSVGTAYAEGLGIETEEVTTELQDVFDATKRVEDEIDDVLYAGAEALAKKITSATGSKVVEHLVSFFKEAPKKVEINKYDVTDKGILFDSTPFEVTGDDAEVDCRNGLVLGPNEAVLSNVDGKRVQPELLLMLIYSVFTLGIWCWLRRRPLISILVTTHGRVINYTREVHLGRIGNSTQTTYFIDHLVYGKHTFKKGRYTMRDYLTLQPLMYWATCRAKNPVNKLSLDFFKFPPESDVVPKRGGRLEDLFDDNGKPILVQSGSIEVETDDALSVSMPLMTKFLSEIMELFPNKNVLTAAPNTSNILEIQRGEPSIDPRYFEGEDMVIVNKNFVAVGYDEQVLDAIDADLDWAIWKYVLWVLIQVFTCCTVRFCYLYMFPFRRRYFVLTDRRMVAFTHTTKGKQGKKLRSDEQVEQDLEFWMISSVKSGKLHINRSCSGLPCSSEYSSVYVEVSPGGTLHFVPTAEISRDRALSFVHKFLSTSAPDMLGDIAAHTIEDIGKLHDLMLGRDEKVIGGLVVQRRSSPLPIKICVGCVTCCLFPRYRVGHLVVTSHRLIEMQQVRVPLTRRTIAVHQNFWYLQSVTRASFYSDIWCARIKFCRKLPCALCQEDIGIGVDVQTCVKPDDYKLNFTFDASPRQAANARFVMALIALSHMTAEEKAVYFRQRGAQRAVLALD